MKTNDVNTVLTQKTATLDGTIEIQEVSRYVPHDCLGVFQQIFLNEHVIIKNSIESSHCYRSFKRKMLSNKINGFSKKELVKELVFQFLL